VKKSALLDLVYDRVDELMREGAFAELNKMFVFVKNTDVDFMLGLLTASLPRKSACPSRPAYFKNVAKLLKQRGETDPTILQGLE
jgi:hypothetical protein